MLGPFDNQHAFPADVVEAEFLEVRRLLDAIEIDVPDRQETNRS